MYTSTSKVLSFILLISRMSTLMVTTTSDVEREKYVHIGTLYDSCMLEFDEDLFKDHTLSIVLFNGTFIYVRDMLQRKEIVDRIDFLNNSMHIKSLEKEMLGFYDITFISVYDRSKTRRIKLLLASTCQEVNYLKLNNVDWIYESKMISDRVILDKLHRQPFCRTLIQATADTYQELMDRLTIGWMLSDFTKTSSTIKVFRNNSNTIEITSILNHTFFRRDHLQKLSCNLVDVKKNEIYMSVSKIVKIKYGPQLVMGDNDVSVIRNYSGGPMLLRCGIIGQPEPLITWSRTDEDDDIDVSRLIIGTGKYYNFMRSTPGIFNLSCRGEANGRHYEQKFMIHLTSNVRGLTEGGAGLGHATSLIVGSIIGAIILTLLAAILMCIHRRQSKESCSYVDTFLDRSRNYSKFHKRTHKCKDSLTNKSLICNSSSVLGLNGHVDFVDPPHRTLNGSVNLTKDFNSMKLSRPGSAGPCLMNARTLGSNIVIRIEHTHPVADTRRMPSPPPYSSLGNLYRKDLDQRDFACSNLNFKNAPGSRQPLRLLPLSASSISFTDHATLMGLSQLSNNISSNDDGTYIQDHPTNV